MNPYVIAAAAAAGLWLFLRKDKPEALALPPVPTPDPEGALGGMSGPYANAWAVTQYDYTVYPQGASAGDVAPPDPARGIASNSDCSTIVVLQTWWDSVETAFGPALAAGTTTPEAAFSELHLPCAGSESLAQEEFRAAAIWHLESFVSEAGAPKGDIGGFAPRANGRRRGRRRTRRLPLGFLRRFKRGHSVGRR